MQKHWECRNVDVFSFTGQENWSQRKETAGTYPITRHEPTLTTLENNYKHSFFSFRQSGINQTTTKIYWNSFKKEYERGKKKIKNTRTNLVSPRVTKDVIDCPLGKETRNNKKIIIKSPDCAQLQGLRAQVIWAVVQRVEIKLGRRSPTRQSCFQRGNAFHKRFPNWCYRAGQQLHSVTTWRGILRHKKEPKRQDIYTWIPLMCNFSTNCVIQCFFTLSVESNETKKE